MRFLLAILSLCAVHAQKQPSFSVDVKLVRLLVNVKNASGELVGSLEREQFNVFDCNVAQKIEIFERYTTKPLSVAVLVDTSGSTAKDWQLEVRSLGKFLKALFGEGNERDAAAVYTFNYDVMRGQFRARRAAHGEQPAVHQARRRHIAVRCHSFCRSRPSASRRAARDRPAERWRQHHQQPFF